LGDAHGSKSVSLAASRFRSGAGAAACWRASA
jgi:hypothetical protein